jgi:hypothetical protein
MIACWLIVFNEIERIESVLKHAKIWASEIVVIDKSSTDGTGEFCRANGCTVISFPYSDPGREDANEIYDAFKAATVTDWAILITASEVPSRALISVVRDAIAKPEFTNIENVLIPVKLYSFGTHDPDGPWKISYQPRVLQVHKFRYQQVIHEHILVPNPAVRVNYNTSTFLLHLTHRGFKSFAHSHIYYAEQEAHDCRDRESRRNRARRALDELNRVKIPRPENLVPESRQALAWSAYCLLVALACIDFDCESETFASYSALRDSLLQSDWA